MHKKLIKTSLQLLLVTLFKMRLKLKIPSKMASTNNSRLLVAIKNKIFNLKSGSQVKSPFALEKYNFSSKSSAATSYDSTHLCW